MIGEVGNFVDRLLFVRRLTRNDNLRGFLPDFFENLIDPFFKKIGGIRAILTMQFAVCDKLHQRIQGKFMTLLALKHRLPKTGIRAGMARRSVLFHEHD